MISLNHGLCLSCPWAGHQNLNSLGIRSDSVSPKIITLAAAGLNTESCREQDGNHVILSPASLHLTSVCIFIIVSLKLSQIQNNHLDLSGSVSTLS